MKAYLRFYQNFFFRGLDVLRGRKNIQKLHFLRNSQFWSKDALHHWQLKRLNELLQTAKDRSPFHSNRLAKVRLPLRSLDEIQNLPICSKKDIKANYQQILCSNTASRGLELSRTGGSTGEPMRFWVDNASKDWNRGSVYRSAEWAGLFLGERTIQMTASQYDSEKFTDLRWRLIHWLQRYKNLPITTIDEPLLKAYAQELQKYRATSIWGYPSGISRLATYIRQTTPQATYPDLKAIITSSETLRQSWRHNIDSTFGKGKVFDHYGSREMYIASECREHHGYHIHAEVVLLEIVDRSNQHLAPGKLGRILVTDLSNHSFPFIRYEIGDVGVLSPRTACPCGVKLPILERVEGRLGDMIILPGGRVLPPHFNDKMSEKEGVSCYQIVQEQIDSLLVKIVRTAQYNQETEDHIRRNLSDLAGEGVKIIFKYVEHIPVPPSGKRQYIISQIAQDVI